jgi:uncharacterized protein YkuJ
MPREVKHICSCGCRRLVTTRTELRHNQGLAPLHVRASAKSVTKKAERATRGVLGKARESIARKAAKTVEKVRELVRSLSPQVPNEQGLEDVEMWDGDGGAIGGDDHGVDFVADFEDEGEVIEGVRDGAWGNQRHGVTIEEIDDEDDYKFDDHDVDTETDGDSDSIHTMSDDEDGVNLEDQINEEWERELAQFGKFGIFHLLIRY